MPLQQVKFAPGIDKQNTSVGAQGRWVDSDNVRFRYGLPEKVNGWSSLVTDTVVGVTRRLHAFVDLDGNRYIAIGTDKFLIIYFEGQLYDVTPLKATLSSATIATTSGSALCTLTTSSAHGLTSGDIVLLDNVTLPASTGYTAADFEDKLFQVTTTPSSVTFTITQSSNATGNQSGGSIDIKPYEQVGPAAQSYGYGWGVSEWGGTVTGAVTTLLDGALLNDSNGTGGSGTSITVDSTTGFPTSGRIIVDNELISYTSTNATNFLNITRGADGSSTAAHSDNSTVTNAADYVDWGEAAPASEVSLEPGLWSLDNFGQVLIATIANGKTFTWNAGISARLTTRASTSTASFSTSANPTATRLTLVSPTTRHLCHFGTETTIGTPSTQDDMFIRFSDQENINDYTETAINSAGDFRLQDGTKIVGALKAKETILVWTDNALYTMKFIGAPFTFGFEAVGTNCGLIGKNAVVEVDGVAYWMSSNGFFAFDGTVKSLPCSVQDFVFDNADTTKGQQVYAGLNSQYNEIVWYYPTSGSDFNDQYVIYNYGEGQPGQVWYTGATARTSWIDAIVYPKPYATYYDSSSTGSFPTIVGEDGLGQTTIYEHEIGTDQVNPDGTTTVITSFIKSFDFDLKLEGTDGEFFLAMRRFIPDFKNLTGNAKVTLSVKRYPSDSDTTSSLSPFTISSSTEKKDTRARGRYANIKIENDSISEDWRFGTLNLDLQPDGRR